MLTTLTWTLVALLVGAAILHLLPWLGSIGRSISSACCRAPMLDVVIIYFTIAPLIAGPIAAGWRGLVGAIAGQVLTVLVWTAIHEFTHPAARGGPRILKFTNSLIGRWRNYTAVWLTAIVTPAFFIVRMAEIFVYPPISWLTGFPRYDAGEWVRVSRHKFSGLIGHDLIWCLYCDWMTGVWSLGSEMLRNVESFWCPIRFDSEKKCANCSTDFPDVLRGWAPSDGSMADVARVLEQQYPPAQKPRAWFGHPARITVNGQPPLDGAPARGNGAAGDLAATSASAGTADERQ